MKKLIIFISILAILAGAVAAGYYYIADMRRELLPPNAVIAGVNVGGLSVEDANERINIVNSGYFYGITDSFTRADFEFRDNIGLWLDYSAYVEEIFNSKSEFWISDLWEDYYSDAEGILRFDSVLLRQFTDDFVSSWNEQTEQPADAYIILTDDCYELINEVEGTLLDAQSVYDMFHSALLEGRGIVDLSLCIIPFTGIAAEDLQQQLQYLNTFEGFRLEYNTGRVINFRYLVENQWLIFNGIDVKLAEYKVIEHVISLGDTYDTDSTVLDKASESVQLIEDIYSKSHINRSMIFRPEPDVHNPADYLYPAAPEELIGLREFLDDLGTNLSGYLETLDTLRDVQYPHYLSRNAFRYADYWSRNPGMPAERVFALVNVNADIEPYTEILDVYEPGTTWLLVNKRFQLPSNHSPDDLTSIAGSYQLRREAAQAFVAMRSDLRAQGLNLVVTSAYRSYSRQQEVHRSRERSFGLERADMEAARPGHSEHQTGLAVDMFHHGNVGRPESANFQLSGSYGWLLRFAYHYGFILSYPEEYMDIHGNIFEPWHWRYVGTDIATAMHDTGINLYDEFYGRYLSPDVLYAARQIIRQQDYAGDVIDYESNVKPAA